MERTEEDIFRHAWTAGDYIADLTCAVAEQVLRHDECIREQDDERLALSAASLAELEE